MTYKFNRFDKVIATNGTQGMIIAKTERNMQPFYYIQLNVKGKMQQGFYENELKKDEVKDI
jgi:hypothetical protein